MSEPLIYGLTADLAEELNITVVGFVRGERLNIYSHPERERMVY